MTSQQTPLALLDAPVRSQVRRASLVAAVAALIWLAQAWLVALLFEGLLQGGGPAPMLLVAGFLAFGLARAGLGYLSERALQASARLTVAKLRLRMIATERRRASGWGLGGAGAIGALVSTKLDLLIPYMTRFQPARLRVMLVPPVILALAFWHAWAVGLVLLVAGPLIPVFMALVGWAAKEASARQLAEIGDMNDLLIERLSALPDIRALGAGSWVQDGFAAKADALRRRTMAVLAVAFMSSTVLELFSALGVALVAVFVGFSLLDVVTFGSWGAPLSPAVGMFLLLLAPDFFQPLRDLAAAWHDKASADALAEELAEWRQASPELRLGAGVPADPLPGAPTLRLNAMTLPSGGHIPLIDIEAGERVALVGPSGSGKTSVLRLLAGLQQMPGAHVTVAGQRLSNDTADAWRRRIGWMPQSPHFLTGSLRRNIDMGRPDLGDMDRTVQQAALEPVLATLPRGLHTRLGETGAGLSGGEGRRVLLARALFARPDVILADEPTADLDTETADLIADALLAQAAGGATLVVATHDMRLAGLMDRIIRLGGDA
ncbi:MAG: thiol reductant ABC exporter subunit CydD [Alphaproteobacteria bacterium]|jgi:ATP-binding cassette subfamily C protein CydD|nr:thiol reductant ABC exporter subunit CydD [Alphaproteobacteria bacterium]